MSYPDHLTNLGLHSLEYRRVYFDLMICFKMVKKLLDLDASAFSTSMCHHVAQGVTQSNIVPCLYLISTPIFFSVRVIHIWTSLPDTFVTANSQQIFISRIKNVNLSIFCANVTHFAVC